MSGVFEEAKDVAKVEKAFFEAFNKTGGTPFKLNTINVNNPKNLFVPVSKINELRRLLYAQIVPDYKKGSLPQTSQNKNSNKGKWIVKTDNLQNLISESYASARQTNPDINQMVLHSWLNMSDLLGCSYGLKEVTPDLWNEMLQLYLLTN